MPDKITRRVQLNYPLDRVKEPVLYHLVMDYGLIPNIRRAQIDFHTGGFIVLELTGDEADLDRGIRFLEETGVTVSEVGLNSEGEWEG